MRYERTWIIPKIWWAYPWMLRRWVAGTRRPGVWFTFPSGRSKCLIPFGKPVESVYGPKR